VIKFSFPPVYTPYVYPSLFKTFQSNKKCSPSFDHYFSPGNYILTGSGKESLFIILKTLTKIFPYKKQVIIPAYTCPTVAFAVKEAGLDIVLCDLEDNSFSISKIFLKKVLSENTLAVVTQYLFGIRENIDELVKITSSNNVFLIEDCSQILLPKNINKSIGKKGDFAFYSFGLGKVVTAGRGGVILVNNKKYFRIIKKEVSKEKIHVNFQIIKDFFILLLYPIITSKYMYWIVAKTKLNPAKEKTSYKSLEKIVVSELSVFNKKILDGQFTYLDIILLKRKENAKKIRKALNNLSIKHFGDNEYYLRYPIQIEENHADDFKLKIKKNNLGISRMYKYTINEFGFDVVNNTSVFQNAERISRTLLTLPVHSRLQEKDIIKIKYFLEKLLVKQTKSIII
jgi:dTDP-4-amino-4,6-dideoxygalactose transaminase